VFFATALLLIAMIPMPMLRLRAEHNAQLLQDATAPVEGN